jgi:hypothetical protein
MTWLPSPNHPDFLFSQLKIKLKCCHFDTNEVIKAELLAVLITPTEHNFKDAFKKWQKQWERCTSVERDYFEDDGGQ